MVELNYQLLGLSYSELTQKANSENFNYVSERWSLQLSLNNFIVLLVIFFQYK